MVKRAAPKGEEDDRPYRVNVLDRAISILKVFRQGEPGLSLSQIAERTELHISTCLRLLAALRHHGMVARDEESGRFRLGYEILALAEIARSTGGLVEQALPVMRELSQRFNETAAISVRSGDFRVDLDQVVGQQPVRRVIPTGIEKPLYAGAASRVLLSGLGPEELDDYLARVPLTRLASRTITDPEQLKATLERIRRDGYAVSLKEQSEASGGGVVAPVYGARGEVVAALGISVPQFRFTPALRAQLIPAVKAAAERVSRAIGGSGRNTA